MTIVLRCVLIIASVLTTAVMMRKIRHSRVRIEDSLFWVVCSFFLIIFSVFPSVADRLSDLVGTYSTSNFIFLFMIFLLLIKEFTMTVKISQMETRIKELVQRLALEELKKQEEEREAKDKKQTGCEKE